MNPKLKPFAPLAAGVVAVAVATVVGLGLDILRVPPALLFVGAGVAFFLTLAIILTVTTKR